MLLGFNRGLWDQTALCCCLDHVYINKPELPGTCWIADNFLSLNIQNNV